VKDLSQRPIAFVLQRRAGLFLVWLHMGSFSPRRVITVNADATPPAPYKLSENPHCLLDKTDLVFLDPVGNGLQPRRGQGAGQGFLGRRSRRQITSAIRQHLRQPQQPLEFPEISHWRKLRHLPLGGAFELLAVHDGLYFNGIVLILPC